MPTRLSALALVLAVAAAAAACKKHEAAAEPPPPAAGPATLSAGQLFADFNRPGQDPMRLLDRYRPGVVVTGTVTNTIAEESGLLHVWLDAGTGNKVTLDFADQGAAAKGKGVKSGDQVSATCQVGGSDGRMMMLTDCALD
jgi:opacity protein-like surface antigen